jgi:hypothetical protein
VPAIAVLMAVLAGVSADGVSAAIPDPVTFALLGDTPYGDAQRAQFPGLVDAINADPAVRMVLHAGDVKNGTSTCDDARLTDVAGLFDTFDDPFVLTPGDNEWTDCHGPTAGRYLPTERLDAVRRILFPRPGRTLGRRPMVVANQSNVAAHSAYRENVRFSSGGVVFASVHVVGADNDLQPWTGLVGGDRPAARRAEFEARRDAAISWIDAAFSTATSTSAAGVLLLLQAEPLTTPGYADVRRRIMDSARAFGRPVLLVHGDEHIYEVQRAYAGVPNLTRLETYGSTATAWLRVTVDARTPEVFSWTPRKL